MKTGDLIMCWTGEKRVYVCDDPKNFEMIKAPIVGEEPLDMNTSWGKGFFRQFDEEKSKKLVELTTCINTLYMEINRLDIERFNVWQEAQQ